MASTRQSITQHKLSFTQTKALRIVVAIHWVVRLIRMFVIQHFKKIRSGFLKTATLLGSILLLPTMASADFCKTAKVTTEINAPARVVFQTITDVASYPEWNPFILRVEPYGVDITEAGAEFDLIVPNPLGFGILRSPEVTLVALEPNLFRNGGIIRYQSTISSAEQLGGPIRTQIVSKLGPNKTLYETEESFCGAFADFSYDFALEGFEAQTEALKQEAERRAGAFW